MNQIELYHPYGFIISSLYRHVWYTLYAIAIIFGILLMLGSVYFLRKWRCQAKITPWDYALQRVNLLDNTTITTKEFYFETSALIKHYCTQRFEYAYWALSDKEMVDALRNRNACSIEVCQQLETIFTSMHIIKFYKKQEHNEHRQVILDYIRFFINTTTPI